MYPAMFSTFVSSLEHIFPVPSYLRMNAMGFDLSQHSIKFIELINEDGNIVVGKFGKRKLKEGIITAGSIVDREGFVANVKKIQKQHGCKFVRLSLPEEHSYLFRTQIPSGTPAGQVRDIIEFQLKDNVPLAPSEVVFDYSLVASTEAHSPLYADVSVYPIGLVEQYIDAFVEADMCPISLEVEGQAIARSLIKRGDKQGYMILDLGESEAGLYVVENEQLVFSATLDVGGNLFTDAIETTLHITHEEAENLKSAGTRMKGLSNKEILEALESPLSILAEEITKHILYWNGVDTKGEKKHKDITSVILSGGNASIPGIANFLSRRLSMSVSKGNPWQNISATSTYIPPIDAREAIEYATAIGLSLRSFD